VLKLEPKGLEIERIKFKPPPKEFPNKFYSVKVKTKRFLKNIYPHNIGGY
jgi:hypothetical protein